MGHVTLPYTPTSLLHHHPPSSPVIPLLFSLRPFIFVWVLPFDPLLFAGCFAVRQNLSWLEILALCLFLVFKMDVVLLVARSLMSVDAQLAAGLRFFSHFELLSFVI
uniref:Uncharacterized protein n=1 Tax=Fagus sylvatica TaxID=28930 RepID=A0A2N9IPV4_FAGSY